MPYIVAYAEFLAFLKVPGAFPETMADRIPVLTFGVAIIFDYPDEVYPA